MTLRTLGKRAAVAVAILAVAAVAPACSGGSKNAKGKATTTVTRFPPTVPVKVDDLSEGSGACGLLSQGEVTSTVGSANPGSGQRTTSGESCRWTLRSGTNQLVAVILSGSGRATYDRAKTDLGSAVHDLPGVADQAFVANDSGYALKGDRLLVVEVVTSQAVATRTQEATKLVTSAASRL